MALGAGNRPDPAKRNHSARPGFARSGYAKPDDKKISVTAKRGDTRYGIPQRNFWKKLSARRSYRCDITFNDDGSWTYLLETQLLVEGEDLPFSSITTPTP